MTKLKENLKDIIFAIALVGIGFGGGMFAGCSTTPDISHRVDEKIDKALEKFSDWSIVHKFLDKNLPYLAAEIGCQIGQTVKGADQNLCAGSVEMTKQERKQKLRIARIKFCLETTKDEKKFKFSDCLRLVFPGN